MIIGLLATMAIPAFQRVQNRSQVSRFANDVRVFSQGLETLMLERGTLPEDPGSGSLSGGHVELADYINAGKCTQPTSLGESGILIPAILGVRCVVGVDFGGVPSALQIKTFSRSTHSSTTGI